MGMVYFVSGIDTDSGKTVAVGLMARYLLRQGIKVITAKLVQTGNEGASEDLFKHRAMMGLAELPEDKEGLTAPQIFKFPASPHLAARLEGRSVDVGAVCQAIRTLATRYDIVLVEGAGGVAVPLTEELLTIDLVAQEKWPIILVTSGKLGSLNHTILSLEAVSQRHIPLAGVVYNECPAPHPLIASDTPRMIAQRADRLVKIPEVNFSKLPDVDFSLIFE
jgi:dethiobiotin synthetase